MRVFYKFVLWEEMDPTEAPEKLKTKANEFIKRFQGYGVLSYIMETDAQNQLAQLQQQQQYLYEQQLAQQQEEEEQSIQQQVQQKQNRQQQPNIRKPKQDPDEVQPQNPEINEDEIDNQM